MDLSKAYVCSATKKGQHCLVVCPHGKPHEIEKERDANCRVSQVCTLSLKKGIIYVHCKKLTKKQIKEFST